MTAAPHAEGRLLYGMQSIADFLGIRKRQALYLVESGRMPTFRMGKVICARRERLQDWLDQQEEQVSSSALPGTAEHHQG